MLAEINHMVHCSPATVSRGGVIYVNAEDVGWKPGECFYVLVLCSVFFLCMIVFSSVLFAFLCCCVCSNFVSKPLTHHLITLIFITHLSLIALLIVFHHTVVDSWIEKLEATEYRPLLTTLFTRYVSILNVF